MIKIYTTPSCSSCRKVKDWFNEQNIPFIETNITVKALSENDLKDMLSKSENGTDDIISKRSKILKESGIDVDSLTTNELIQFIKEHPTVLKRPIMVDDHKIQVGYNPEDIRVFIPHAQRVAEWACSSKDCPKYDGCDHAQDNKV